MRFCHELFSAGLGFLTADIRDWIAACLPGGNTAYKEECMNHIH